LTNQSNRSRGETEPCADQYERPLKGTNLEEREEKEREIVGLWFTSERPSPFLQIASHLQDAAAKNFTTEDESLLGCSAM
jgi:hypothetical protein